MKITVTQEDINRGEIANCKACPIAFAASRAFNKPCEATPNFIAPIYFSDKDYCYHTPYTARQFMVKFDNGFDVSPFEFELTQKD